MSVRIRVELAVDDKLVVKNSRSISDLSLALAGPPPNEKVRWELLDMIDEMLPLAGLEDKK